MDPELTREEIIEMLPAYVLGALEPDEMLAVEAYLEQHHDLLPRLHSAAEAAAQLAYLAPATPLPNEAGDRLMRRIRADLRLASTSKAASKGWWFTLRHWFSPLNGWTVAAGAATAALLVMVLYMGQTQSRLNRLTVEVEELHATVHQLQTANSQLEQTNQGLQQQLQSDQARLAFIANANPQRSLQVPGTEAAPQAKGTLYVGNSDQALLLVQGLEPLPGDQTYQLWVASTGQAQPVSAGLVILEPAPANWIPITLPPGVSDLNVVGLSIEPVGGSPGPGPSGPIVLLTP